MIKTEATYTEYEVSRILRDSEGQSVSEADGAEGHAEGRHELQSRGRNRSFTTLAALQSRIVGYDRFKKGDRLIETSGAFDGCQARAIAFALNLRAGQTALSFLARQTCAFLIADFDISGGGFAMVGYDISELEPAPSGARFVAGPNGLIMSGILKERRALAMGLRMKLMKTAEGSLHIRTAFPLVTAPRPQIAEVHWKVGGILEQHLPV